MWKPMLPTLVDDAPLEDEWVYEVKYDGFRCGFEWNKDSIHLWSRNGNDLASSFPEIIEWCKVHQTQFEKYLPLFLDGEIVILNTKIQTNFSLLQQRGRLKSQEKITNLSRKRPASLMVFDLIKLRGKETIHQTFVKRRTELQQLFNEVGRIGSRMNLVDQYSNFSDIKEAVFLHQGEGIVAKQLNSKYIYGKRTTNWQKIKNWRQINGFITGWNVENDYFDVSIYVKEKQQLLGKIKHGFSNEEKETLSSFIKQNGQKVNGLSWKLEPSVCIELNCLDVHEEELREPVFNTFRFDLTPEDCTKEKVNEGLAQIPEEIELSKPDKKLFDTVTKRDFVVYLRNMAPYILPRLKNKRLTMIRYPDGINEHSFYQKHLPDYAPSFIKTVKGEDEEEDIICNDLKTLLWFGNHAAIEYHVPFQTINETQPDEMVFDLDPPSLKEFPLAVFAAQLIRDMCEAKGFHVFIKTSGRTGLQLHIPLHDYDMTFDDTREFMEAVAKVLVQKYPKSFTIERLKKNRGQKLYIDYVQHASGKTIIAPYSPRATKDTTVATPLFWDEVNEHLDPRTFTIHNVPERVRTLGCPFFS
ncbi:DNA ligase D [Bacillaceae bacterium W0354]